jgi:hypothetical protein
MQIGDLREKRLGWTENEISALKTGVELYGSDYDAIKSHFKSELNNRSARALCTKSWKLMKQNDLDIPYSVRVREGDWTEEELSALKTGLVIYGRKYDRIKSHFKSEFKNRSVTSLKTKVWRLMQRSDLD